MDLSGLQLRRRKNRVFQTISTTTIAKKVTASKVNMIIPVLAYLAAGIVRLDYFGSIAREQKIASSELKVSEPFTESSVIADRALTLMTNPNPEPERLLADRTYRALHFFADLRCWRPRL